MTILVGSLVIANQTCQGISSFRRHRDQRGGGLAEETQCCSMRHRLVIHLPGAHRIPRCHYV